MNERSLLIKEKIEGIVMSISSLFFIGSTAYEYYSNQRAVSPYVILIYSYGFLILCSLHSLCPNIICSRLTKHIGLISNYIGKGFVMMITGVLYHPTQNWCNKITNYVLIAIGLYCFVIEFLIDSNKYRNNNSNSNSNSNRTREYNLPSTLSNTVNTTQ